MSVFVLKCIALASMLLDHTGAMFQQDLGLGQYALLRSLGRAAFPIFAYLIAEGMRHTHSRTRYLFRLGFFALISEIPYDLFGGLSRTGGWVWLEFSRQNIFFTLFLGALASYWYETHRAASQPGWLAKTLPVYHGLIVLLLVAAGALLHTDYGAVGVLMILGCSFFWNKWLRLGALLAGVLYLYAAANAALLGSSLWAWAAGGGFAFRPSVFDLWLTAGALAALGLIACYNGRQGPRLKWFFYVFYPAHLLLLCLAARLGG
jgi:hypothetical protein